jgi:hypothetical protein
MTAAFTLDHTVLLGRRPVNGEHKDKIGTAACIDTTALLFPVWFWLAILVT